MSSGDESDTEKCKKRRKKKKKTNKTHEDKSKDEHEPDEEAQNQIAVVRQVSGQLEANVIYAYLHQIEQQFHRHFIKLKNQDYQINNQQI